MTYQQFILSTKPVNPSLHSFVFSSLTTCQEFIKCILYADSNLFIPCLGQSIQTENFPPKVYRSLCRTFLFMKEIRNGFYCLNSVIKTLGTLFDNRVAEKTLVFISFLVH